MIKTFKTELSHLNLTGYENSPMHVFYAFDTTIPSIGTANIIDMNTVEIEFNDNVPDLEYNLVTITMQFEKDEVLVALAVEPK